MDITREVMASIIGTTTESVIRALSDFKARGWIQLDKSKVIFLNLSALKGMSQIENELIAY
ncbi:MAG TPA: helix-turn-helix domain-containing protein [Leptospiraceae bacterium]|nr:helix-turn-helix domain-containing protein [Leptospiraceae bacterium]